MPTLHPWTPSFTTVIGSALRSPTGPAVGSAVGTGARDGAATAIYPAAVSQRSAKVLSRRPRGATVLAVHPLALYLSVDHSWPDPGLLPVVAPSGLRLPNAVVLGAPLSQVGWGVQPGDRISVGDGEVRLPGATIRRTRFWRPVRVPTADQLPGVGVTGVLGRLASPHWAVPARHLATTAVRGGALAEDVRHTVGAGQGLTPSGDDVLCGLLLALRLAGADEARRRLWSAVHPRLGSTSTVSAALLTEAADGYAVPAVIRLASALVGGREHEPEVGAAAQEVRAIGHTSGADLLAGLAGGLAVVGERRPGRIVLGLHSAVPYRLPTTDPGVTS